ncbi:MAG: hypothetical protein A2W93_14455 [Bacteroidetes bacterium GWF2_43_63]|nr:MAG: hypothetical protein A2W94_01025 [Bacteroidetes bacterium GWE2_42_42]OFY52542.1 MAG: hypothetical protein A2W93_14455 [Bacteroidetes bacterium GWF2_43_63]HBG71450.1 hypothetical protein [Bacteroidales bacterium]HCB60798.1 hypothetical protein [Bacteroidales bacterium]HCY23477.1 hypothetical protein [Bacteroidales bacterium]
MYKGKAIYNPSGKAGEYSLWACNFYTGCSNNCQYCYCKRGVMAHTWSDKAKLKACFRDEKHALEVFEKELEKNIDSLREHGLFFTFTSDPMLPETIVLTYSAVSVCLENNVPVKILTKRADWFTTWYAYSNMFVNKQHLVAYGFTLTGYDELEPGASTNQQRVDFMQKLHNKGFKTWASIEPIIFPDASFEMIAETYKFCDHYKIGLQSGSRYNKKDLQSFVQGVVLLTDAALYFKDSLLDQAGIKRESLPSNCVGRDYNIFKEAL